MAVPRPILLAVLGLLLVTATFLATRNANQASESSKPATQPTAVKVEPKPKSNPPAKAQAENPASKPAEKPASASASKSKEHARPVRERVSKPKAVATAVADGRVVVLAFFQQRAADDTGTRQAVADLRRRHLARVYTDSIDHIGRYGQVVGKLGINQAPAVVIIDADRHARLIEGYVDPESLAQEVSDARK